VILPLAGIVLGTIVITAGLSALVIAMSGRQGWWSGWVGALSICLAATLVSLVPISLGLSVGGVSVAYGYLGGTTVRLLSTVLFGAAALYVFRAPTFATLVLLLPLYMVTLIAECTVLWRTLASGKLE
jgi:hypothetical protein